MEEKDYIKQLEKKDKIIEEYKKKIDLLNRELEYYKDVATMDYLTKLVNRRGIKNTKKYNSLILGDIDCFKKINDEYGHNIGDNVLVEISKILKNSFDSDQVVCRWGGEEFLIMLKDDTTASLYQKVAEIKDDISNLSEEFGFDISMSFGISDFKNKPFEEALSEADQAMYESKNTGRNKITIFSECDR